VNRVKNGQSFIERGECPVCHAAAPGGGFCAPCRASWNRAGPPTTTLDVIVWTAERAIRMERRCASPGAGGADEGRAT
jgi:hypothetical protein